MATVVDTLKIAMGADTRELERGMKRAESSVEGFAKSVVKAAAGVFAFDKLKDAVVACVKEFAEAEKVQKQLAGVAGKATAAFEEQAKTLQKQLGVSDELVMELQTLALRHGVLKTNVDKVVRSVLDFSAATGQDAKSAMSMLIRGVDSGDESLARLGIRYKATGMLNADLMSAVDEMGKKFGGAAATAADTFAGRLAAMTEAFSNLKEEIGALFDKLDQKYGILAKVTGALNMGRDLITGGGTPDQQLLKTLSDAADLNAKNLDEAIAKRRSLSPGSAMDSNGVVGKMARELDLEIQTLTGMLNIAAGRLAQQQAKMGLGPAAFKGGKDRPTGFKPKEQKELEHAIVDFSGGVKATEHIVKQLGVNLNDLGRAAELALDPFARAATASLNYHNGVQGGAMEQIAGAASQGGGVGQGIGSLISGADPLLTLLGTVLGAVTQAEGFKELFDALNRILQVVANLAAENLAQLVPTVDLIADVLETLEPLLRMLQQAFLAVTVPTMTLVNIALPAFRDVAFAMVKILYDIVGGIANMWNGMVSTFQHMLTSIASIDVLGAKPLGFLADFAKEFDKVRAPNPAEWNEIMLKAFGDIPLVGDASARAADKIDRFSESLTNVPAGFKVAARRFQSANYDRGGDLDAWMRSGAALQSGGVHVYIGSRELEQEVYTVMRKQTFHKSGDYGMGGGG